jgi:hypothetical protein
MFDLVRPRRAAVLKATKATHFLDVIRESAEREPGRRKSCSSVSADHCFRVVIKSIREFNHALPFVPREVGMASGEIYEVPHRDCISISPRGSYVIIMTLKSGRII